MQGQLVNAQVGRQLHPQSPAVAGGMTYRPQGGAVEDQESHKLPGDGSSPSPAPVCAMPTKAGDVCGARPTVTGLCVGHSRSVAKVIGGLFGGC